MPFSFFFFFYSFFLIERIRTTDSATCSNSFHSFQTLLIYTNDWHNEIVRLDGACLSVAWRRFFPIFIFSLLYCYNILTFGYITIFQWTLIFSRVFIYSFHLIFFFAFLDFLLSLTNNNNRLFHRKWHRTNVIRTMLIHLQIKKRKEKKRTSCEHLSIDDV